MLLSTYLSEAKKLREAEIQVAAELSAAESQERDSGINSAGSSDVGSFEGRQKECVLLKEGKL
jgi:hypothetical protein